MPTIFNLKKSDERKVKIASNPVGLQGDVYVATPNTNAGIIDVINDMRFTGSNMTDYLKSKTPYCVLKEYELLTNSAISSLLYTIQGVTGGTTAGGIESVKNFLAGDDATDIAKKLMPTGGTSTSAQLPVPSQFLSFLLRRQGNRRGAPQHPPSTGGTSVIDNVKQIAGDVVTKLKEGVKSVTEILENHTPQTGSLLPYQNLYTTEATGFNYIFPYYGNDKTNITSAFSPSQGGLLNNPIANKISGFIVEGIETIAQNLLFASPGVYIERPKFFNLPDSGPQHTIRFCLINTFNAKDVQTHYDFLFLLAFQNLPYRKDLAKVILPRIYTFILPGEVYLPYAYISEMKISFEGNRRTMTLQHPIGTSTQCIVPDVYDVSITVTGLNPNTGNFMVSDKLTNITSAYNFIGDSSQDDAPKSVNAVKP